MSIINISEAHISTLAVHQFSNDENSEISLSEKAIPCDDEHLEATLLNLFFSHFKEPAFHRFQETESEEPQVQEFATMVFEGNENFIDCTHSIMDILAKASNHPNIKSGDLIFSLVEDIIIEDELVSAFCIIKSENKDDFLQLKYQDGVHHIHKLQGIGTNKLDKACLIFNTNKHTGYKILIKDNVSSQGAHFWTEFLKVVISETDFNHTAHYIQATKTFVQAKSSEDQEFDKLSEIEVMDRASHYINSNEKFNSQEYANAAFGNASISEDFKSFVANTAEDKQMNLSDDFNLSAPAIKKNIKVFKSVIKLDKNFHIYVHGNRELIQKGEDDDGKKYYKVYYREEL